MIKKTLLAISAISLLNASMAQQNALDFDGINDFVNLDVLAAPMAGAADQTIQMWIQADMNEQNGIRTTFFAINDATGGNKLIFDVGGPYTQQGRLMIYSASGLIYTSSTVIGDNQCHHILFINSNNAARIFIDGVYAGMCVPNLTLTSTDRYSLGQEWDNATPSDFYNGTVDEFSIWNLAYFPSGLPGSINNSLIGNEPGLIGYYKFDQGVPAGNNSSINYLSDYSSPTYDGTLVNFGLTTGSVTPTAFSNWVSGACFQDSTACQNLAEIDLDGINDYVNINSIAGPLSGSTNFTIEFWMSGLTGQQADSRNSLFAVNGSTGSLNRFMISIGGISTQTGNLVISDQGAWGTQYDFISSQIIGDGLCHHIAYTRSGSTGTIYIDGSAVGSHVANFSLAASDLYSIGQEYDAGVLPSQFFNGIIDDFRLWNTVRTSTEIMNNMMNPLTGSEPGLVTYYNFNQGIPGGFNGGAVNVFDMASNNDGTLVNFTLNGTSSNWVAENCVQCVVPPPPTTRSVENAPEEIISSNDMTTKMTIYPNPTNGDVRVNFAGEIDENAQIFIHDLAGKLVYSSVFKANTVLETSGLEKGVYLVSIRNYNQLLTEKLIIQ